MSGFQEYVGQSALKEALRRKIEVSRQAGVALPHLLLCGVKERGKSTFAIRLAEELGVTFTKVHGEELVKMSDLGRVMSQLRLHQILLVKDLEQMAYAVMNGFREAISKFEFGISVGAATEARIHTLPIPRYTVVATTTKPWLLEERLLRWFISFEFSPYSELEAAEIAMRVGLQTGVHLRPGAAVEVASLRNFRIGEIGTFLQRFANHFTSSASSPIDRDGVLRAADFLGMGPSAGISLVITAERIKEMSGIEFEHWTGALFRRAGFEVEVTKASGDHGIDLWAVKAGRIVAVQCKRWDGSIGEPVVREFYGAMISAKARTWGSSLRLVFSQNRQ
jgi:DNA polymerase III delta prime subunit